MTKGRINLNEKRGLPGLGRKWNPEASDISGKKIKDLSVLSRMKNWCDKS